MSKQHFVTRDSLKALLADPSKRIPLIGRALVVLFNKQTVVEQKDNITVETNYVGFNHADSRCGALTAKYFLKHRTLTSWMVDMWMKEGKSGYPRLCKYWSQLDQAAYEKDQRKKKEASL